MRCEYFALCDNEAVGVVRNPIIGLVPTCERCADHVGAELHVGFPGAWLDLDQIAEVLS